MKAGNRVILNTGILYSKMVVTMFLSLLSTKWVLEALGVEDFGIYNLVAGIIAMFSFLNVAMAAASQRFLSFAIGKEDFLTVKRTFMYSVILHLAIALCVVLLLEVGGMLLVDYVLDIPAGKVLQAKYLLHFLSAGAFFTILSVPYQAVVNAHENMLLIALVNIMESVLKLVIAFVLLKIFFPKKLLLYAVWIMGVQILSAFVLYVYCRSHYKETRFKWVGIEDRRLFNSMLAFSGWNLIGSMSSLLRNQGVAVLLNSFFGVVINAAYGIANQVNGQISFFSNTIVRAMRPQIVKSEGAGDRHRMLRLSSTTCKLACLMLSFIVVPVLVEMPFVLRIWLKNVPDYSVVFCRLILVVSLIQQVSIGLSVSIESVGKIKYAQIFVGGLHLVVLPVGYLLLRLGYSASSVLLFVVIEEVIAVCLRIYFAHRLAGLHVTGFLSHVLFRLVLVIGGAFLISYQASFFFYEGWGCLFLILCLTTALLSVGGYFLVLDSSERKIVNDLLSRIKTKICN